MEHRANAILNLHPGFVSLGGWRDGMKSGFASQGRMSGLCAPAGRGGHRDGEKPGPCVLPPEDFGHEHFGFASLCFFLSLLNDLGYLGDCQKRLPAFLHHTLCDEEFRGRATSAAPFRENIEVNFFT